ncbi:MAG: hypothetical protein WBE37_09270 [Bryobacteraceae bacterium]
MGKFGILLALALTSAAASGFAASPSAAPDAAAIQNTFVKPWIAAMQSKDKAAVERLYHPAVRACMNPATKEFFDFVLEREVQDAAGGTYHVTKIARMQQPAPTFLPEEDVKYPVRPAYEVQIAVEHSDLTYIRFLASANGSWYEVYPCPNQKGMAYLREQQKEGTQQRRKVAQLAAGLKDPLRSELKDLLRQQRKIDAVKKYEAAASVDLTTAVLVMDALQNSKQ